MRFLHTMLRVRNLDAAMNFYCNLLGMKEVRRREDDKGRFTLVFLAANEDEAAARETGDKLGRGAPLVELTYNWDTHRYELGSGFGHIAIGVNDIYATCAGLRDQGVKIVREPGPMKHGTTVIAFVEDPDGYKVELIQRAAGA